MLPHEGRVAGGAGDVVGERRRVAGVLAVDLQQAHAQAQAAALRLERREAPADAAAGRSRSTAPPRRRRASAATAAMEPPTTVRARRPRRSAVRQPRVGQQVRIGTAGSSRSARAGGARRARSRRAPRAGSSAIIPLGSGFSITPSRATTPRPASRASRARSSTAQRPRVLKRCPRSETSRDVLDQPHLDRHQAVDRVGVLERQVHQAVGASTSRRRGAAAPAGPAARGSGCTGARGRTRRRSARSQPGSASPAAMKRRAVAEPRAGAVEVGSERSTPVTRAPASARCSVIRPVAQPSSSTRSPGATRSAMRRTVAIV